MIACLPLRIKLTILTRFACDYTLLEKGDALHVILHRDRNYKPNVVIYVGDDIVKISGDLEVLLNFQEQDSFPLVLEKFQVGRQAFKVNVVVDTITVEFDGASIYSENLHKN